MSNTRKYTSEWWKWIERKKKKENAYSVNLLHDEIQFWYEITNPSFIVGQNRNANCLEVIILLHELYKSDLKRSFKCTHFRRVSQFDQWYGFCENVHHRFRSKPFGYSIEHTYIYICCANSTTHTYMYVWRQQKNVSMRMRNKERFAIIQSIYTTHFWRL